MNESCPICRLKTCGGLEDKVDGFLQSENSAGGQHTRQRFADHLFQDRGIRVRKSAMRDFCARHEIRPYRPTYRYLRGDPAKPAEAREELADLKKGRRRVSRCF